MFRAQESVSSPSLSAVFCALIVFGFSPEGFCGASSCGVILLGSLNMINEIRPVPR